MPIPRLTRRQDPIVTRLRELARGREAGSNDVLLDGTHVLLEALRADVPLDVILATTDRLEDTSPEMRQLWSLAAASGAAIYDATTSVMDAASPVRTPSGIVALGAWSPAPPAALWEPAPALVVGLVDVQDPGNAGAVVRCADGLDATGVAMLGSTADPGSWKSLRGAMGSTFRLPVARGGVGDVLADARTAGVTIVATVARDSADAVELREADLTQPVLLLLGNEGAGLSQGVQAEADVRVYIDMRAGLDSFNVSVTAGLLLYEARRQRESRGRA
ncbi:MAG: RNA methyltransferase [Acidimicrobiia bacterium]|nr:RNA methyltransferase [Acidimicrobiia bacterium]